MISALPDGILFNRQSFYRKLWMIFKQVVIICHIKISYLLTQITVCEFRIMKIYLEAKIMEFINFWVYFASLGCILG